MSYLQYIYISSCPISNLSFIILPPYGYIVRMVRFIFVIFTYILFHSNGLSLSLSFFILLFWAFQRIFHYIILLYPSPIPFIRIHWVVDIIFSVLYRRIIVFVVVFVYLICPVPREVLWWCGGEDATTTIMLFDWYDMRRHIHCDCIWTFVTNGNLWMGWKYFV